MASQKTKFMVGIFVAGGFGIALVAFIWLGMSRFLETGRYYAVYFNESVQGLTVDSPVKYRGVAVGKPVVVAHAVCRAAMAAAVTASAGVGELVTTTHSGVAVGGGEPVGMGVMGGGPAFRSRRGGVSRVVGP